MPQNFVLNAPDGQAYNLSVPDGATEEQIRAKVDQFKQNYAQADAKAKFSQSVDSTPVKPLSTVVGGGRNSFLPGGVQLGTSQENPTDLTLHNNAAEVGVDIHSGLDANLRGQANLLDITPNAKTSALEYLVSKRLEEQGIELPPGVPAVFKEDFTGKLAYWQATPEGKLKPTLVNPPGLDSSDSIVALDEAAQVGIETMAAIGGGLGGAAATGGSPVGAAGGAAIAVGAANAATNKARTMLASAIGLPDEIVEKINSDDMLYEALLSGGFELAGPAVVGAFRGLRNKYASGGLDPADLKGMQEEVTRIKALSDEIFDSTGIRIQPTLGGATGNEALLVAEANTARDAIGTAARDLKTGEIRNRANTGRAIRAINDQEVQTMPRLEGEVDTTALNSEVKDVLGKPGRTAEEQVARAEQDQLTHMDEASALWDRKQFAGIQSDLRAASDLSAEAEDIAWNNFRTQIELNPETGQSNIVLRNSGDQPIPKALAQISQESQQALSDTLRASQAKLVEDLGWKPDPETGMIPRQNLADATLDANQLHVLLSHLKDSKRTLDQGNGLGWRGKDIDTVISAIEEQMGNGTWARRSSNRQINPQKAELISASWELANDATVSKHALFNEKAVRNVIRTDREGNFLAQPNTVRGLLFKPGNAEPLRDVMEVVGRNPEKQAAMLDELNTLYRENVFTDGKFSKGQHDAFLSQYNDHINLITGDDTTDFISNAADFERVVKRSKDRAASTKDMMERAYGRRLTTDELYGGNVADNMLSDQLTNKQVLQVRDRLNRNNPELWGEVKAQGLKVIEEKLLKSGGNEANSATLGKLLTEQGDRIGAMYGPKYKKNLENMQEMLRAMETGKLARGSKTVLNPPWLQVMRSVFGPLSPIQRRVTAGTRFMNGRRKARMQKFIADPEKLGRLVEWSRMSPESLGYLQGGFALFGAGFRETLDENQVQTLDRLSELKGQNTRAVAKVNDERGRDASRHR